MSTRRGFLGALMALPVVAPAVAKELAASQLASGGFAKGVVGVGKLQTLSLEVDTSALRAELSRFDGHLRTARAVFEEAAEIAPEAWERLAAPNSGVPNRLYGAEINHRGEAI